MAKRLLGPPNCLWAPPFAQELDDITLHGTLERPILGTGDEGEGGFANCDVWVSVPEGWADVTLSLRTQVYGIESELARLLVTDIEHPSVKGGRLSGLAMQVRGRPMFGRLTLYALPGEAESYEGKGKVSLMCWGDSGAAGDRAGQQLVRVYARPEQALDAAIVVTGTSSTELFSAVPNRRINVTSILSTTPEATARLLELQTPDPQALVATRAHWVDINFAPVMQRFDPPIRGERGGNWTIAITAAAGSHYVTATGFLE